MKNQRQSIDIKNVAVTYMRQMIQKCQEFNKTIQLQLNLNKPFSDLRSHRQKINKHIEEMNDAINQSI